MSSRFERRTGIAPSRWKWRTGTAPVMPSRWKWRTDTTPVMPSRYKRRTGI